MEAKFPGLFCRYEKSGRDWIKALPDYEIKAFARLGFMYSDYGRIGGRVRAQTAKRDHKGRFAKNTGD